MAVTTKYNINQQLSQLPRHISIEDFVSRLVKQKISESTFYRDRKIAKTSKATIPTERLEVYAALFNITVDELKNYEPPKIKPITQQKVKPLAKKLGLKSGK